MAHNRLIEDVDSLIKALTSIENPHPIQDLTINELLGVQALLVKVERQLDPNKLGHDTMQRIRNETQYRTKLTGRGPAVEAILGKESHDALLTLCDESMEGQNTKIVSSETGEPISGTEGRGGRQFAADILFYLVTDKKSFLDNANRRVWKWHRKNCQDKEKLEAIDAEFGKYYSEPTKTLASVSPETAWAIWLFLTGRGPE